MANFKAPLQMVQVWTDFKGQLGHLYQLGDWKTAESWPMLGSYAPRYTVLPIMAGHRGVVD